MGNGIAHGARSVRVDAGKGIASNGIDLLRDDVHGVERLVHNGTGPQCGDMSCYSHAMAGKHLFCDTARDAKRSGEPPGKMAAARYVVMAAIFDECSVIGMSRSRNPAKLLVVDGAGVVVDDDAGDGGSARVSVDDSGVRCAPCRPRFGWWRWRRGRVHADRGIAAAHRGRWGTRRGPHRGCIRRRPRGIVRKRSGARRCRCMTTWRAYSARSSMWPPSSR